MRSPLLGAAEGCEALCVIGKNAETAQLGIRYHMCRTRCDADRDRCAQVDVAEDTLA